MFVIVIHSIKIKCLDIIQISKASKFYVYIHNKYLFIYVFVYIQDLIKARKVGPSSCVPEI